MLHQTPPDAGGAATGTANPGGALLREASDRIDALVTASAAGGPIARERAEDLVHVVVDLYGAGIQRLLEILDDRGVLDDAVLDALAADELVSGLLLVHGLHPDDVPTRVARALDGVRPYLGSHGGDVELVGIGADGVVRLRLTGSCDGCSSSAATLELAVEGAVRDAAPEVTAIEVEQPAKATVIPVSALRLRTGATAPHAGGRWHDVDVDDLAEGRAEGRTVAGVDVVLARIGQDLFAFRGRCPGCASSLAGAALQRRAGGRIGDAVLRCPGCGHHFDVRGAGAGIDHDETLPPLPLLMRGGGVQVAVPAPTAAAAR